MDDRAEQKDSTPYDAAAHVSKSGRYGGSLFAYEISTLIILVDQFAIEFREGL
jgi:hypothetical protein